MGSAYLHQKLDVFFQNYKLLQYKKRNIILCANDVVTSVYYIKSGYIRVYRLSEDGEELTINILKPHDIFPFIYGTTSRTNVYYLEALTPLELWRIPQEEFMEFIYSDPDIYKELTNHMLVRFDGLLTRMEYMMFSNAHTKVVFTLLSCANKYGKPHGKGIMVQVPLTHKDIATLIGITRETTSLEMKRLEKSGLVSKVGKFITITDIQKLEAEIVSAAENVSLLASL